MLKKVSFICLVLIGFSIVLTGLALAQCPEGKSEVQITTPSGKQKTICIPDAAVPGIENASEHGSGTIIPATCPCWKESELDAYVERFGSIVCYDNTSDPPYECLPDSHIKHYECEAPDKILLTHLGNICVSSLYCANEASMFEQRKISDEEYDACLSLIKKYIK